MRRIIFLALLFGNLWFAIAAYAEETKPEPSRDDLYRENAQQIKLFGEIYRAVSMTYVDEINAEEIMTAGIEGMLATLDPYTVYFKPEDMDELEIIAQGEYGGVGIEIGLRGSDRALTVISPIDDTPAARKGLMSGDIITHVDGKTTKGFSVSDAANVIRGPEGTNVTLTIHREGIEGPLEYVLTREAIRIHDVSYAGMLEGGEVGYVKLSRFSAHAGDELKAALTTLMAQNPRGLVLDLRSNPGGLLPAAVDVAGQFLPEGTEIVSTRGRISSAERELSVVGSPLASKVPMVVLVNGGSASASEIVAGAIQDHDRGIIMGTTSFGKGLVQSVKNLSGGAALKITTAKYFTPSGRLIQKDRKGLADEVDEEMPEEITGEVKGDGEAGVVEEQKYFTDSGRTVLGGGGITPDIRVEPSRLDPAIVEMYRKEVFFEFIAAWKREHGMPTFTSVDGPMLVAFNQFLTTKEFKPPTRGSKEIEALRELGRKDSLSQSYFSVVDQLERSIAAESFDPASPKMQIAIRQGLAMEIASTSEGLSGRIRASFAQDVQLAEAVKVLKDNAKYNQVLVAAGPVRSAK